MQKTVDNTGVTRISQVGHLGYHPMISRVFYDIECVITMSLVWL